MFKSIIVLSIVCGLIGCQSDGHKDISIADDQGIIDKIGYEKYNRLEKNGDIRSSFLNISNPKFCNDAGCIGYDYKSYYFKEQYFNDSLRKGVYTIKYSDNLENKDCVLARSMDETSREICFTVVKNENDKVKSNYEWYIDNSDENENVIILKDLFKNEVLFKKTILIK